MTDTGIGPATADFGNAGMPLRIGVLGASSMVYTAVIADAIDAVSGVTLVHEATRGAAAPRDGVRRSTDYAAVLEDSSVDLVYIPLPNHLHEEWVVACAEAGKHVLCEKPLAIDAESARRMAAACADAGVVLMEAYMSPFHPRSTAVQRAVEAGAIGTVQHGVARMSGMLPADNHRWQVAAGGGALLDVGIYCLEPVLSAMGWVGQPIREIDASSRFGGDGVDESTAAQLVLDEGAVIQLWVSFAAPDQQQLQLTGASGAIEVHTRHATPDHRDRGYDLRGADGEITRVDTGTGSCYEGLIAHAHEVIVGGAAPLRPPSRSIAIAEVLDGIAVAAGHRR